VLSFTKGLSTGEEMEQSELVSIILPTHNGSQYIKQSLESCLNQTYRNIELIVVNDASEDDTGEIACSYDDPRIIYLKNESNMGLANSLNKGFLESKGDYLTWTSDDNFYAPDALARMLSEVRRSPSVDFVYANYYRIDENGKIIERVRVKESLYLLINNCVGPCFLYTRRVYEKIGDYNPDSVLAEDYEYWIRALKQFKMHQVEHYLYYHRFHRDSLTAKHTPEIAAAAAKVTARKHLTLTLKIKYHLMIHRKRLQGLLKSYL
jgi:glycosyltransferase involved in cell wall biosynthesis